MLSFICEPCQLAATIIENAKNSKRGLTPSAVARAKRRHGQCPGGTQCDCQHRF